ncbi:hypothetical protein FHG87_000882 [Trinorchestia longiramus]|nr:hypothetical protein FHG87_000882 [Trinorchestia longiramus]
MNSWAAENCSLVVHEPTFASSRQLGETKVEDSQTELKSCDGGAPTKGVTAALSPAPSHHPFAASKGEKRDSEDSVHLPYKRIPPTDSYHHIELSDDGSSAAQRDFRYSMTFGSHDHFQSDLHIMSQFSRTSSRTPSMDGFRGDPAIQAHLPLHDPTHDSLQLHTSNHCDSGGHMESDLHVASGGMLPKRHMYSSKPKIWSLADTAACKTPPPPPPPDNTASSAAAGVWLAGGTTFPLPPTIPPTNSSSQSQYPRFSHLMPGALPSQYMATSYNEGVGTDTPPQTPPNAKGSNGQGSGGGGQAGLLGGAAAFMGASSAAGAGYGIGGPLSSCSRSSSGLSMPSSDVTMNPAGQRYSNGGGVQVGQATLNNTNPSSMVSTAFTPVYKSPAQQQQAVASQQSSQQQVNSSQQQQAHSQQAQQNQQQQVSSQTNVLNSPPSVGSLVPSSYVS